jgi:hypothetical protein
MRMRSHIPGVVAPSGACARDHGHYPADRCRACAGYDTRLRGTVFETTRHRSATRVLRRGIAKGELIAHLARELGVSRTLRQILRPRSPAHLHDTVPTEMMTGIVALLPACLPVGVGNVPSGDLLPGD